MKAEDTIRIWSMNNLSPDDFDKLKVSNGGRYKIVLKATRFNESSSYDLFLEGRLTDDEFRDLYLSFDYPAKVHVKEI